MGVIVEQAQSFGFARWKKFWIWMVTVADFILGGAPKSLQMVTAAMKLEDAYSLDGKI